MANRNPMTLLEFLELANEWQNLGHAVQEQLQAIVDGKDMEDQNPNALRMIARFLQKAWRLDDDDLGTEIVEYLESDKDDQEYKGEGDLAPAIS